MPTASLNSVRVITLSPFPGGFAVSHLLIPNHALSTQLPPGGPCGEPPSNIKSPNSNSLPMAVYYLHYAISTLLLLSPFSSSIFNFQLLPGGPCGEPPSNTKSCAFAWPSISRDDALSRLVPPRRFQTLLSLFALTLCFRFPFSASGLVRFSGLLQ